MNQKKRNKKGKKSIFTALFIPIFFILILQAIIFYVAAVYGGIEETMNKNSSDILTQRLINRKNELETLFTRSWTNLSSCESELNSIYKEYLELYGDKPFTQSTDLQLGYLTDASDTLIKTLRNNGVNGIFLILNNKESKTVFPPAGEEEKMGLCIRDLDQTSNYIAREDLLVIRAPSAMIPYLDCSLESWWEARYSFSSEADGAFYYNPLNMAWDNPGVDSRSIAYFESTHKLSDSDQDVISYSIPLMDENGYPYGVLGIEITTKYLGNILPNEELGNGNKSCYILGIENTTTKGCTPIVGTGPIYSRCFGNNAIISCGDYTEIGGFNVTGRDGTVLYGEKSPVDIYDNNNPFKGKQLMLMALVDEEELFSYIAHIKTTLATVSLFSLLLGLCGIFLVSRHFSAPIKALAKEVQTLKPQGEYTLGRLGISEIDQLVDAIEGLNQNASRDIARTEFFSRMSHDMRTPMNAINSFSSLELLEETTEAQKVEYLKKIHTSGEYLLGLINEVLDITKIESNKIDIQYIAMNTRHIWDTILPIIEKLAQKKGITFQKEISMEDAMIKIDQQHISQVVMNLLSNAVKFTPQGGIVKFKVSGVIDEGNPSQIKCTIIVSDSGIGMSESFMENLYQSFVQENEGREGTGLGLSIAKKLTELMNGSIECVSRQGEGTTFTLNLAFEKCSEEEINEIRKRETRKSKVTDNCIHKDHLGNPYFENKHVLVCEDHPLNTQIIVRLLERVGFEVDTAENGKIGLDILEKSPEGFYDAVLLDIRMPVMGGLETSKAIRSLDRKDVKEMPIIAMTANAFTEDVMASKEAGMNAHLSKPIEPQKLYKTLQLLIK